MRKAFTCLALIFFVSCGTTTQKDFFRKEEYETATKNYSYQIIKTEILKDYLVGGIQEPSIECELKEFKKARDYFQKNYVKLNNNPAYWIKAAICNYSEGNENLSLYLFKRAQKKFTNEPNSTLEINLAIYFHKLKNYSLAYEQYKRAEKLESDNLLLRINFARLLLKIGYFEEALEKIRSTYQIAAFDSEVLHVLGTALTLLGKHDLAIKTYQQMNETDIKRRDIAINYALALIFNNQKQDALSVLENSVKSLNSQIEKRFQRIAKNLKS